MAEPPNESAAELAAELEEARRRIAALQAYGGAFCEALVRTMHDGLSVVDAHGVHVEVNPALCAMTGFTREELVGTGPPHPYWPPEELASIRAAMTEPPTSTGRTCPLVFRRKSGERFPVLVTTTAVRDAGGAVVSVFAVVQDTTELRRMEVAAAEREQVFRLTFDRSPVGTVMVGPDFRFRDVNDAFCTVTGYAAEELERLRFPDITHPDDVEADTAGIRRLLAGEIDNYAREKRYVRKDGCVRWGDIVVHCVRDEQGAPQFLLAIIVDVTERREAQERSARLADDVRAERDRLAALVQSIPDEIWFSDAEGRFTLANAAAAAEFGSGADPGTDVRELAASLEVLRADGTPRPVEEAPPLRALAGEVVRNQEEIVRTPATGEQRYRLVSATPVTGPDGDILGTVSVVRDVTDLRRAGDALRESEARYHSLVAASHEGIALQARDGTILAWNAAAQEVFGPAEEEVVGLSAMDREWGTVHEDGTPWPAAEHPSIHTLTTGEPCDNVLVGLRRGGEQRWLNVNTRPLWAEGDALPYAVVVSFADITAQRAVMEALEAERARAQSYLDVADVMLVALDTEGVVTLANRKACEVLGYDEGDIKGRDWFDLAVPREVREPLRELYRALVHGESRAYEQLENPVVTSTGEQRLIAWQSSLVPDAEGRPAGILRSGRDITVQREAEQALCDSEERYRLLVSSAYDAVWAHEVSPDGPGRIVEVNDRACALLGYSRSELLELDISAIDLPEPRLTAPDVLRRLSSAGHHLFETDVVRKDGARAPVEISASQLTLRGRPLVLSVARDVGERRRVIAALRELQTMRDTAERVARVGSWRFDPATALVSWSPETYVLYDVDADDFSGDFRPVLESRVHPDDRAAVAGDVARYEQADQPGGLEFRVVHRDGSVHLLHGEGRLERDSKGAPAAVVGFVQDVTEQREAESEIRRLNAELEERVVSRTEQLDAATRELEALAYSMAHDVRAPLRTIDGFSAILMEEEGDALSAESLDSLRRVRGAAQTLAGLMDDLSGLSAVSRHELARRKVDVSAVAVEVAAEVRAEHPARRVDVDVLPGLGADADPHLVRLIFRELLDNAWKFTVPRRHAHVQVGAVEEGGQRAFVVRDDGVGFDMAYATHLFGAFQRMHPPGEFAGNGIGLAMVQRLVRRHGGRVWAESQVGKGTAVFFTLPTAGDG